MLLCLLGRSKIQKVLKQIKVEWKHLPEMNEILFKKIFWIKESKNYTKSESLLVVNNTAVRRAMNKAFTLALCELSI